MRTVVSGLLQGMINIEGGPTGQVRFIDFAFPVTVEIEVLSPGFAAGKRTVTATRKSPTGLLIDIGMPPPVRWTIRLQAASKTLGLAVRWKFLTDWTTAEVECNSPGWECCLGLL